MTRSLKDKIALVTGSSRGIGRAIALDFAREGADVALNCSASVHAAEEVAGEIRKLGRRAFVIQANVADKKAVDGIVQQVVDEFEISRKDIRVFSICIRCNSAIIDVDKQSLFGQVPDYVWETHDRFHTCRQCDRIFWPGSHTERVNRVVERLFE